MTVLLLVLITWALGSIPVALVVGKVLSRSGSHELPIADQPRQDAFH